MAPKVELTLPDDVAWRDLGSGWRLAYTRNAAAGENWLVAVQEDVLKGVPDEDPQPVPVPPPAQHPIPPRGLNVRPLAYLAREKQVRYAQTMRDLANRFGHDTLAVRFYASQHERRPAECGQRVRDTLAILDDYGLLGHPVISDSVGDSGYHHGDNGLRRGMSLGHLPWQWYANEIYKVDYARYLDAMPLDARNVLSWQLINEPGTYGKAAGPGDLAPFLRFVMWASDQLPVYDVGLVNSAHITGRPERAIYAQNSHLRFVGIHMYYENGGWYQRDRAGADAQFANELGLPIVFDEVGVRRGHGDRDDLIQRVPVENDALFLWDFGLEMVDDHGALLGRDDRYIEAFLRG